MVHCTSFPQCGQVPVAQLDKASDYESEDWGFKSLQGLTSFCMYIFLSDPPSLPTRSRLSQSQTQTYILISVKCHSPVAWMPERSKGVDLRSTGRKSAWVRTPLQAYTSLSIYFCSFPSSLTRIGFEAMPRQSPKPPWPNG